MTETFASPLTLVVGAGGVGKTTVASSLALNMARAGQRTLVMTFDPSLRLKDTLGIEATDHSGGIVAVPGAEEHLGPGGKLDACLLEPRATFDALVERYAPDAAARDRILNNRYYSHLAGSLAGILEYMAVERLFEVVESEQYDRIVLDTPPTRQALDFLEAPQRILAFLDSGALKIATRDWFDKNGKLTGIGPFSRGIEGWLDRVVGLQLLRDMVEFFQAFGPLYKGFHERAEAVQKLLRDERCEFVLVGGPDPTRVPDTLFFARKLREGGHRLGPVIVNRVQGAPTPEAIGDEPDWLAEGRALFAAVAERNRAGVAQLKKLFRAHPVLELPQVGEAPTDLSGLARLGMSIG